MALTEEFKDLKANKHLQEDKGRLLQDISKAYQGLSHRVNQQAAEIEDLWKKVDKIAAYLRKKFPEDFVTKETDHGHRPDTQ